MKKNKQTICLNMIVKDEAPVIRRCLDSVKQFIDTWVIVDTGSTDDTQQIIKEHLKGIPGELLERPWQDFAHNRSEALVHARGRADYVFIIDADEILTFDENFELPELDNDAYLFTIESGGVSYFKTQLVNNQLQWSFKNVVHEYIYCEQASSESVLPGVRTLRFPDGARARDQNTYRKDALTLERALIEEPDNMRYVFYLAQSYRDANETDLAIRNYQRRADMGGWVEEIWYSRYQIAELMHRRGDAWSSVSSAYLEAYQAKPDRAEPLFKIGIHHQKQRQFHLSHLHFQQAMAIRYPSHDRLFIEKPVYDYMLPMEYAVACYYIGDDVNAIRINNKLLLSDSVPAQMIGQIQRNRKFSLDRVFLKDQKLQAKTGRVLLLTAFQDPGSNFDNLIESILTQEYNNYLALLVDAGSQENQTSRIPSDDRFMLVEQPASPSGSLAPSALVALWQHARQDDIVVILSPHDWLESADSFGTAADMIANYNCSAIYGQFRWSDGHLGHAMPTGCPSEFDAYLDEGGNVLPFVFRMSDFSEWCSSNDPRQPTSPDGKLPYSDWIGTLGRNLLRWLGFAKVRFNEQPLLMREHAAFSELHDANADATAVAQVFAERLA